MLLFWKQRPGLETIYTTPVVFAESNKNEVEIVLKGKPYIFLSKKLRREFYEEVSKGLTAPMLIEISPGESTEASPKEGIFKTTSLSYILLVDVFMELDITIPYTRDSKLLHNVRYRETLHLIK